MTIRTWNGGTADWVLGAEWVFATLPAVDSRQIRASAAAPGAVQVNNVTLSAEGTSLSIGGTLTGYGVVDIGQGGRATLAAVTAEQTVLFTDATGTLVIGAHGFDGLVAGFQSGDEIDVTGVSATSFGFDSNDGVLSLFTGTVLAATIEMAGVLSDASFHLIGDGAGGVLVTGPEQRDFAGGSGDWYTAASWTTPLAPYANGFPVAGDIVLVTAGTVVISAADITSHGTLDQLVIELDSSSTSAPVTLAATGEHFGAGVTLVAQGTGGVALSLTGASGFAGTLDAGGSHGIFGLTDSGAFTNSGLIDVYNYDALRIGAATLINDGQIDIGEGALTLTQGVVLGQGAIELGSKTPLPGYYGNATLTIVAGVTVGAGQQLDFLNGLTNDLNLTLAHSGDFAAAIDGFVRGDTIALAGLIAATDTYSPITGTLSLFASGASTAGAVLDIGIGYQTSDFTLTASGTTTLITTARATGDGADQALHGDEARATYGVDGTGITIGIISDSFNALGGEAGDIASGDLPANVNILKDVKRGTDEGRAMAELIHRIAPGATIDFYAGTGTQAQFATAVGSLAAAGAQIIVDDLGLAGEPYFESGDAASTAITNVLADGKVSYFSAIGNDGPLFYQGTYSELDSALPGLTGTVKASDFGGGNPLQALTVENGAQLDLQLQWDQPFANIGGSPGSQNSLSMYLFNSSNVIVASATKDALGGNPIQELTYTNKGATGVFHLAIAWDQGTVAPGIFKYIDLTDGADGAVIDDPNAEQGSGTAYGHDQVAGANIVGAVDYVNTPAFDTDPAVIEDYSDPGPGLTLYGSDGQLLATPQIPNVPDFLSVDGPSTSVLDPFYGTSAAAPDAAAVAALMLQANPTLTNTQITTYLEESAISLGLPGSYQGAGLIQADRAVALAEAACFLVGTRIATPAGEIPIEALQISDLVCTAAGAARPVKWIGRRRYDGRFAACNPKLQPIRIRAGAMADGVPVRDLFVSPLHALLIDDVLIPASSLVNGISIDRFAGLTTIDYLHIELATHDAILAEGVPAETFVDCDSRLMFSNAAEFFSLYPDDAAAKWAFCAKRVTEGAALAAIQSRLAGRAGDLDAVRGKLTGFLDEATRERVSGWAFHPAAPGVPVRLELHDENGLIATMVANEARPDVHALGLGPVHCGFSRRLPVTLSPFARHTLRVVRAGDGTELGRSPREIEPEYRLDDAAREGLAHAIASAALGSRTQADIDSLLDFLVGQTEAALQVRARLGFAPAVVGVGDDGGGRLALFIDERLPMPERDAGSLVAVSHMRALQALGFRVLCVPADMVTGEREASRLRRLGIAVAARPLYGSVEAVLRRHGGDAAVVYLHRVSCAAPYGEMARQLCPSARLIFGVADLHHLRLARQAVVVGDAAMMRSSRVLQRRELAAAAVADVVVTHSSVEAAMLARDAPGLKVQVVPWLVRPRRLMGGLRRPRGVAFIGGHDHAPNRDAVAWLLEEIMPRVWAVEPNMPCLVAGHGWPAEMFEGDRRVRLMGPVRRLSEVLGRVRLTVAPLRFGAGVKGKVLESLAAGVPCVMSGVASEGIQVDRALVADDAAGIAERICRLHGDRVARAALASAGVRMIAAAYGDEAVMAGMRAAVGMGKEGWALPRPAKGNAFGNRLLK